MGPRKVVLVLILIFSFNLFCPTAIGVSLNLNPDSIKQLLESSPQGQQLEILISSTEKILHRHPQEAVVYAQRALSLAIEEDNKLLIARVCIVLAKAQYLIGQYSYALANLELAHEHYLTTKDSIGLTESYQLFGQIFTRIGDFKKALDSTQVAFVIADMINAKKKLAELLRETGNIYFYFGENAIALDFYQRSLAQSQLNKDKDGIAKAYNNMGRLYSEIGKFNMALDLLKKALEAKDRESDRASYGNTLLNIGTVYHNLGENQKAITFYEEARIEFSSVNFAEGMSNSMYYQGVTYSAMGRYNQALALQQEAWNIASSTNTKRLMVLISRSTAEIYEKIGDYRRAYSHIQTYLTLRDSVFSDEKAKLLIELETKHQLYAKQRQIELLSKDKALTQSEKNRSQVLIALLSLIALFFVSLTYFTYSRFKYKSIANEQLMLEIRHRKRVEAQLNEYQDHLENIVEERTWELKVAKDKAEEADTLKTAFLTNMSHEIRTPMNAIVGFSYLLTDPESTEDSKTEYIKIIKSNGEVLMNLINDILDISLIESGQLKTKFKSFVLTDLLDELKFFFEQERDKQEKTAISIQTDYDNECERLIVNTDNVRLRQILSNLLWNALKFTNEGQITFGYRLSGYERLIFFVKDTGTGIESSKHEVIFDRFSKFSFSPDSTIYSGTGLGLAICSELVGVLGGKIWLDSVLGKGSTFYFTLPYEPISDKDIELRVSNFKIDKDKFLDKTILIAEDVYSNFKLVEAFLDKLEMNILWAKDGVETLNLFRENPKLDIILLDIQMPIMDGLSALKNIRRISPSVPVIVNTAFYLTDEMEKSFASGCNDYISKPIRKEDLLIKLSQFL